MSLSNPLMRKYRAVHLSLRLCKFGIACTLIDQAMLETP